MAKASVSLAQLDELVALDTGGRDPRGWQGRLILGMAFVWTLFQLYTASTLPFTLSALTGTSVFVVNNTDARFIHLAFASFLAALAYPLFKSSPRDYIPWYDWVLGFLGVASCLYLIVFKDDIAVRAGLPTTADLIASSVGLLVLGVAVYRSLGLPLVVVASVFMMYTFFGGSEWMPDAIQWKGASFGKAMWHYWMQTEGVFGVALGVSATMIFLFVCFGSILEKSGAGNFFIKIAFAMLGHFRGGPAKAAVVASALSGIYSGSSIANTVTTGTFTIPLMKRTGFSAEKAGAIEVASSTNGQLTPPVMGAAAFLIAEYTGVSYTDIVKHAFLPAVVSYITLIYIVHLEAMKLNLKGLTKPPARLTLVEQLIGFLGGFISITVLGAGVYFGLGWIKTAAPDAAFAGVVALCVALYLVLLWVASRGPNFWATIAMIVIALTQHPIKALMRNGGNLGAEFKRGSSEWFDGMVSGARNMISIGVATGAAGIIVGTISLTGAHQVVGEFVEFLSSGSLMLMLLLVALMSLILGMGLPTTANYIVVSSLMAPVIVALGAKNGLIVPLVAVHMFVFYFGILADDTPPVGLAAFAAAAISHGDPIKTGIQGFAYDIRTAILPFMFIFNTELLLINVTLEKAVFLFIVAVVAMMTFASATQHYFLTKNRVWETCLMLVVAFSLLRPGFWLDIVDSPYVSRAGVEILDFASKQPENAQIRIRISGPDYDDASNIDSSELQIDLGKPGDGSVRLQRSGLLVLIENGIAKLDEPLPATEFSPLSNEYDFYVDRPVTITEILFLKDRLPKELFYIPAFLLIGLIVFTQRRRRLATN